MMTKQEYERKFAENTKLSGYGMEVTQHMPCPFCAASDWAVYRILDVHEEMAKEHVCKECGRGAKALIERNSGGVQFEVVQTVGDNPPDYVPRMRRVN